MKPITTRSSHRSLRIFMTACLIPLFHFSQGSSLAGPVELGRLFYTPAQRTQLENARTQHVTQPSSQNKQARPDRAQAPIRFDGVVIRSDGKTTRWVDGKAQVGASSVSGLKPGQIRADGKVYEPYQVLRPLSPNPAEPVIEDSAP